MKHTPTLTKNQITAAVEFWANQVQSPQFRTLSREERQRPDSQSAAMAEMMAVMLVKEVPPDVIAEFRALLTKKLTKDPPYSGIHVDYAPEPYLANVGNAAGVPIHNWPWKTNMWFEDGKVLVSCGYGGAREDITLSSPE